ncbi:MAG: 4-hydroxy-tetrahydrodipicolinate synthase [Defluviitaleaceae bacterium]|nr:4-hydroxy-tetrahydrodipicolinate synthase [Defluviitaleaceae bacterium]
MPIFTGVGTAIVTPFDAKGNMNFDMLETLVRYQIDNGADAIVACGTTGEVSTLDNDEHVEVARATVAAVKKAGRKIPVISGAGGNDTRNILLLGNRLKQAGVDALMLTTPYYNKTSQRGLVEHFSIIAAAIDLPFILYNVPTRTSLNMSAKTTFELSKIENIAAIKEASGNIVQIAEIAELCGDNLDIYAGNDDYIVPVLSLGGKGVISTTGNIIPKQMHDMIMKYLEGDVKGSAKMQLDMLALVRAMFSDINPMPVKAALGLMGFDVGACRRPLTALDPENMTQIEQVMKDYGLI